MRSFLCDEFACTHQPQLESKCFEGQLPKNQSTIIIFFPLRQQMKQERELELISISFHRFN